VPDALVNPEQTIQSQDEMSNEPAAGLEGHAENAPGRQRHRRHRQPERQQ
jgi:hypothetical protein